LLALGYGFLGNARLVLLVRVYLSVVGYGQVLLRVLLEYHFKLKVVVKAVW